MFLFVGVGMCENSELTVGDVAHVAVFFFCFFGCFFFVDTKKKCFGGCCAGCNSEVQQKEGIKYGDWVSLQNGYASWQGGFLDTRDKSAAGKCTAEFLCVSTAVTTDRDRNSGRWVITSATGKAVGSAVKNGDLVRLKNMFSGGGGYLDVNTRGCTGLGPDGHCVSTSHSDNRDRNSGTWKVIADWWVTDITSFTQVRLQNYFNNFNGGYLDVNGNGCFGNLHCVATATGPTRHGGSTYWRMFRNPAQ